MFQFSGLPASLKKSVRYSGGIILVSMVTGLMLSGSVHAESLYKANGKTFGDDALSPKAKHSMYDVEKRTYDTKLAIVEGELLENYIEQQAKKQGKSREDVEKALFAAKEPTDKEVKDWYEKNKARIQYPFEQIKGEIARLIKSEGQNKIKQDLVAKIKKETKFEFLLSKPVIPIVKIDSAGYPVSGNEKSSVTVVEFADYQCPHCKHAYEIMKKIKKEHKDKFKFIFMDFPINRSGISRVVAEGAYCANEQGKFWEYHGAAFDAQSSLSKESPKKLASDLKLDEKKFEACLKDSKAKEYVARAEKEAQRIGVHGTPAIFVNGKKLDGLSEDFILNAIKEASKKSS